MPMPKAPVDKDDLPPPGEYQVRFSGQPAIMEAVPEPVVMQHSP